MLDLVGQIFGDFSATSLEDQRSFLNGRMGEKIFGDNITIYDDAHFPLQTGAPFDGEGVPRQTLTLVKRGVPQQIAYSAPVHCGPEQRRRAMDIRCRMSMAKLR